MKISAHCNMTNPERWGYPYLESIKSFSNFCDEVIVVDGGSTDGSIEKLKAIPKVKVIQGEKWKEDFDWKILGRNLQIGLDACKNDWCFKFDLDYIFHEQYVSKLKNVFDNSRVFQTKKFSAISVKKINLVTSKRAFSKKDYPFLINKKGNTLKYEIGVFADTPTKREATFLYPVIKKGIGVGTYLIPKNELVYKAPIEIYSYDFTFMTKEQVGKNRRRFDMALTRHLGSNEVFTEEISLENIIAMAMSRYNKCTLQYAVEDQSKFIQEKIKNIKEEQLGYNIWGNI